MPLDRYPIARPSIEAYPVADQVLALRIKVQTAHQFGMITLPAKDRLIITSGVRIKSIVGAMDNKGRTIVHIERHKSTLMVQLCHVQRLPPSNVLDEQEGQHLESISN